jgi:hypothetical protein
MQPTGSTTPSADYPVVIDFQMAMWAITKYVLAPASYLVVLKDLRHEHCWLTGDYDEQAAKTVINMALNFVWGAYRLIDSGGFIGPEEYIGLPASEAAASQSTPDAPTVLIVSGGRETAVESAVRFISAGCDDLEVDRLLKRSMSVHDPSRNNALHRGFMISLARQRIDAQS